MLSFELGFKRLQVSATACYALARLLGSSTDSAILCNQSSPWRSHACRGRRGLPAYPRCLRTAVGLPAVVTQRYAAARRCRDGHEMDAALPGIIHRFPRQRLLDVSIPVLWYSIIMQEMAPTSISLLL